MLIEMNKEETKQVAEYIDKLLKKDSRILCLAPEKTNLLSELQRMGYSNLYGISNRPNVYDLPRYNKIRYFYCNSLSTHLPPRFFDCIIAPGTVLHEQVGYLSEILKDDSFLICNEHDGIYSKSLTKKDRIINNFYCFQKTIRKESFEIPEISILTYSNKRGGISEYTGLLYSRLSEKFDATIYENPEEIKSNLVIIEYANGLEKAKRLIKDARELVLRQKRVIVEVHDSLSLFNREQVEWLEQNCSILVRSNESASYNNLIRYFIMPHISYTNVPVLQAYNLKEIQIGSFGFSNKYKRHDLIIETAKKLKVPVKLLISINEEIGKERSIRSLAGLEKLIGKRLKEGETYHLNDATIKIGFFSLDEIRKDMESCSHILFAHKTSRPYSSGTMTLAKRFMRPVVSTNSIQAKMAQVIRVDYFIRSREVKDNLISLGSSLLRRQNFLSQAGEIWNSLTGNGISNEFLSNCISETIRDDDGFDYLLNVLLYAV